MKCASCVFAFAVSALLPRAAAATSVIRGEERIAVIVGANLGREDDEPLRFAEHDARRFRDLLLELGGLTGERSLLILGTGPEQVLQALIEARGRAAEITGSGKRVAFFFYYSGHGDEGTLHLPRGDLALDRLHEAINAVPADLRISFLDACQTTGREKGLRRGPPFSIGVSHDTPRGEVELRAASTGEAGQESDELGGAVFTHYLISGLRGSADLDGDGQVTLDELYTYAYRHTLRRTGSSPSLQHAAMQVELRGAGELVLTHPAHATATLELPDGDENYLVFEQPSDSMLGEVAAGEPRRIALPAGRYLIAERGQGKVAVASIDLSWGGRRTLRSDDFEPIGREEWAARGGHLELHPWQAEIIGGIEVPFGVADHPAARTGVRFISHQGDLELMFDGVFIGGGVSTTGFEGSLVAISGGPRLGRRFFFGPATIIASAGADLRYTFENLTRIDAARAEAAGFNAKETHDFASFGPNIGLAFRLSLTDELVASLEAHGDVLFRRTLEGLGAMRWAPEPIAAVLLGVGYAF
jgi:hypothetical protein